MHKPSLLAITFLLFTGGLVQAEETPAHPKFVAVGGAMRSAISPDGKQWETTRELPGRNSDKSVLLRGVAANNDVLVAVGNDIQVSRDGRTWTKVVERTNWLGDVVYGDGKFVAVGYHRAMYSQNGTDWSQPVRNEQVSGRKIAYGDGRFVAVGWMTEDGQQVGYTTTSTDAKVWQNVRLADGQVPRCVAFGNGKFVIVGTGGFRAVSADGLSWKPPPGDVGEELRQVLWTGEQFIATGSRGGYSSKDGMTWEKWADRTPSQMAYGDGLFIGCNAGRFSYSTDGQTWTPADDQRQSQILEILYWPAAEKPAP